MNLLFRGRLSLITPLRLYEVYDRLTNLIGKEDSDEEFKKKYVGTVFERGFKLKKAYKQMLSTPYYSCEFTGAITSDNDYTLVNVTIRPNKQMLLIFRVSLVVFLILVINTIIPFSALPCLDLGWSIIWLLLGSIIYIGNLIAYNLQCNKISKELISELSAQLF